MQTEGETDTDADTVNNGRQVKIADEPNITSGGHNLFDNIDDEKSWDDKELRRETNEIKRQLKHYITQSNLHDVRGLPEILNTTVSDLESGADLTDVDTAGPTIDILNVCARNFWHFHTSHLLHAAHVLLKLLV